jgi:hypothetical protein
MEGEIRKLAVGDIVKICDDSMRHGDWPPIGRIVAYYTLEKMVKYELSALKSFEKL